MVTFPTIYRHGTLEQEPIVEYFDDTMAQDPAIRSRSDGGYITSRARFTRITRRWTVRYEFVSKANKDIILSFENARLAGAENFIFSRPDYATAVNVRFLGPVTYTPSTHANFLFWTVEFVLEQV